MLLLPTSQNSECQILEIPLYNTDANRPKKIANGISHYPLTDRANRKLWPERFTTNKQTSIQLDESIFSTNSISSNSEKEERKNGRGIEIVEKRESNLHFAIGETPIGWWLYFGSGLRETTTGRVCEIRLNPYTDRSRWR